MASDKTAIHWTEATWNPVSGCSHVSDGCRWCYAEALSLRFGWSTKPWTAANAGENVVFHPARLDQPLRWKRPRMVFVNSMSDLFHEQAPLEFLDEVYAVMASAPRHTFQILTKRPERMRDYLNDPATPFRIARQIDRREVREAMAGITERVAEVAAFPGYLVSNTGKVYSWPLPNCWAGVSIEQDRWCSRADILRQTPAAVRFISAEPLLEPLPSLDLAGIDWLISGGESGPRRRPFDPDWARDLRDRCLAAGVAYFHKQGGGVRPGADRLLDGRLWEQYPDAMATTGQTTMGVGA